MKYVVDFDHKLSKDELRRARRAYYFQKRLCSDRKDAIGNPIIMKLSFSEWLKIWIDSGKFPVRGNVRGCYCMSRYNDIGDYEVNNVFINRIEENIKYANTGKLGKMCGSFKGEIVATNSSTGRETILVGQQEIVTAGFDPAHVYKCVLGKQKYHLGHTFFRRELTTEPDTGGY